MGPAKIHAWALLVILSFVIVADLKHLKGRLGEGAPEDLVPDSD